MPVQSDASLPAGEAHCQRIACARGWIGVLCTYMFKNAEWAAACGAAAACSPGFLRWRALLVGCSFLQAGRCRQSLCVVETKAKSFQFPQHVISKGMQLPPSSFL